MIVVNVKKDLKYVVLNELRLVSFLHNYPANVNIVVGYIYDIYLYI